MRHDMLNAGRAETNPAAPLWVNLNTIGRRDFCVVSVLVTTGI